MISLLKYYVVGAHWKPLSETLLIQPKGMFSQGIREYITNFDIKNQQNPNYLKLFIIILLYILLLDNNSSTLITHLQPDESRIKSPPLPAQRAVKESPAVTPQVKML